MVVDWLISGLYIMLKNNDKIVMSPELFHTVYANPRVMYNFATYIKVAT